MHSTLGSTAKRAGRSRRRGRSGQLADDAARGPAQLVLSRHTATGTSTAMMPPCFSPVVAIEVDGLLAVPDTYASRAGRRTTEAVITMSRSSYPRVTQGEPIWDANGTWTKRWVFSRLGVDWVNDLLARGIDVVWASTWLEAANTVFGPVLGFPQLPVVLSAEGWSGPTVGDAKVQQVARRFDGRPLLLVTDLPPLNGRRALGESRRPADRAVTRMQLIPGTPGVSDDDVEAMDRWLELAQTAEGHEELRRQRRRALDRARRHAKTTRGDDRIVSQPPTGVDGSALPRLWERYAGVFPSGYLDDVRDGWPD